MKLWQKDLLNVGKSIIVEGTKAVTFSAGINVAAQGIAAVKKGDVKTTKELFNTLDLTIDTLLK